MCSNNGVSSLEGRAVRRQGEHHQELVTGNQAEGQR